jgi:hypothetical protein
MEIISTIEKSIGYIRTGIETVRNILMKILSVIPLDEKISLYILFFGVSLYLAYLYVKNFTTSPFSAKNLFYLLILAVLIFMILMYL